MKKITFDKKIEICKKCNGKEFKSIRKLSEFSVTLKCKNCGHEKIISQSSGE